MPEKLFKPLVPIVLFIFGLSFNIMFTLKLSETHIGIRLALSDVIMPLVFGLFLLVAWRQYDLRKMVSPTVSIPVLLMTLWLSVSLFVGYRYMGELSNWALVNKYLGWYLLLMYMCVGLFIGRQERKYQCLFLAAMLGLAGVVCVFEIMAHWFYITGFFHEHVYVARHIRMQGLMQNPNAFGIFLAVLFVLHISWIRTGPSGVRKLFLVVGSMLVLLCIYYSFSRSSWIGLVCGCFVLIAVDWRVWKTLLVVLMLTAVLNFAIFSESMKVYNSSLIRFAYPLLSMSVETVAKINKGFEEKEKESRTYLKDRVAAAPPAASNVPGAPAAASKKVPEIKQKQGVRQMSAMNRIKSKGFEARVGILKRSLSYWKENPVAGIGLGSHLWNSKREGVSNDALTIHNTVNWLLVETGIIGLGIMLVLLWNILKIARARLPERHSPVSNIAFPGIIFVILGASLATEVMYQRYFWLLLGFFLVNSESGQTRAIANEPA